MHHLLDTIHANAQFPMPLEKFLLRSREVFIINCADTQIAEMCEVFGASEPYRCTNMKILKSILLKEIESIETCVA
jgi:hypothetical protein